jgi:hypothetical protein
LPVISSIGDWDEERGLLAVEADNGGLVGTVLFLLFLVFVLLWILIRGEQVNTEECRCDLSVSWIPFARLR